MNKSVQFIVYSAIFLQCSVLMAMDSAKGKNISDNLPYMCSVNYYNPSELEKLVQLIELPFVDGSQSQKVTLPLINNPFDESLIASAKVTVNKIEEETFTLEKNGFEVVDFSDDSEFVALLKEFYELDYVEAPSEGQAQLKRRFSQLLKVKLDQWIKAKKMALYRDAYWTPIRGTDVAVRTSCPKKEGDMRQPPLPLLHSDYPNSGEFRRYVNMIRDEDKVNPEPEAKDEQDFVSYINIWAPTDESVGGMPLALIDTATMSEDDFRDGVIVPIIDEKLIPEYKFIGRSINFDEKRHKLYSVAEWKRGKVIVFYTFKTPHTAVIVQPEIPRNSVETRGFIWGTKIK